MARDIHGLCFLVLNNSHHMLSVYCSHPKGGKYMKMNFSKKLIWTALKGSLYLAIGFTAVTTARGVKLALSLPDVV